MRKIRQSLALVVLLSAEAVAVVAVQRAGTRAPFDLPFDRLDPWLRAAPGDALAAALRAVALICAWWLFLVTLAYASARVARIPGAVRACESATPVAIRRTDDRALAASIVVGAVTSPLGAPAVAQTQDAPTPSVIVSVRDGRSLASLPADGSVATAPAVVVPAVVIPRQPDAPPASPGTVVVASGDNLWDVAAAALARATGRDRADLGDDEIAIYWQAVCDANRDTVQSGDVNLVYPGEVVLLPPAT